MLVKAVRPRLLAEAVGLGVLGALGARLFTWMLRVSESLFLGHLAGYAPPGVASEGGALRQVVGVHGLWLIPVSTTLGGLLSGILVYTFAPEAEGHGTDAAVAAFHRMGGYIRARVAPVKLLASAITIGSGGAAGREGPIALITAGLGSIYGTLGKRTDEERRILLLAGMAAGLSAIFRTPMGTAVFAIEVLYGSFQFETGVLLYMIVASGSAYALNGLFVGWQPLFRLVVTEVPKASDYGWFLALGVVSGLVATVLPEVFYRTRDFFHGLKIPAWTKPALGGLGVGLIALKLPEVLGGGYGWIQLAMNGELAMKLMLILVGAKLVAFALTVSSGGSGGVFAPSLYVGAMLGGVCAVAFHQHHPAVFVVVGMAAVFGAAARVPVATMLMVTEMAGGYQLLVPAGSAVMVSYLLQVWLSGGLKYGSMYEAQVPLPEDSPAHYEENVRIALGLLGRREIPVGGKLDLLRMLRSRVRFSLPGGRQMRISQLKPESGLVGKTVDEFYAQVQRPDVEVVAVMRREHVVLAHPETKFEGNDRLLLVASTEAREALKGDLVDAGENEEAPLAQANTSAP